MKGEDFVIKCAFSAPYPSLGDDKYLVELTSGKLALYSCKTSGYYKGTGQKDWNFTFIRYLEEDELEVRIGPSTNIYNKCERKIYNLKRK